MEPLAASGLLVGLLYGYAAQRGAFCMNSGFRTAATRRDFTKVKALLLAVGLQAVLLPLVFAAGVPRPDATPFSPLGAVVGGLVFGAAMKAASGCAAGSWYKLGGGSPAALATFAGLAAGAVGAGGAEAHLPTYTLASPPPWLAPAAGAVLLAALAFSGPGTAGAWSWRRTGTVIGLVALLAWPVTGGRGVAMVPGAVSIVRAELSWDTLFVLGIPAGAWVAARPVTLGRTSAGELAKALVAGLVLGAGAALAGGCTVGHGLAGLPLLSPQAILAMIAIFAGSALVALRDARRVLAAP